MDGTKVGEAKGPNFGPDSAIECPNYRRRDHFRPAYNPGMLRAASWSLLVASLLTWSAEAQRTGGFHGPAGLPGTGPAFAQRGAFAGAYGSYRHRGGFYPYFLPDFLPYDQSEEAARPEPLQRVLYSPEPERTSTSAQLIEIPAASSAKPAEPLPAAIFVLTSGERLEARRFLLTSTSLSVQVLSVQANRGQRVTGLVIPIEALDLDATVAASRERGIQLQIPADRNEISLSF